MKDKREILTKDLVAGKLMHRAKQSMVGSVLMLALTSLMFGMIYVMTKMSRTPSADVAVIVESVIATAFFAGCLFCFIRGVLRYRKARKGEFSVIEDVLTDVKDMQFSPWQMLLSGRIFARSNYQHVFTFQSGKVFVANNATYIGARLETASKFSLPGDTFFLAVYNDSPDRIRLLYSAKSYQYKDGTIVCTETP